MPNTVNSYIETDLGNVSPNPRGEYNAKYDYEYLDLIYYKGGSYLCLAPLGETIKNVSPIEGQTTTNWQCVAIPGDLTPEYISMYNEVVKDYNETNTNTADVAQMKASTYASMTAAQESESKASTSETNARNSEVSAKQSMDKAKEYSDEAIRVNNDTQSLVTGFDEHVATAISNAEASISESTDNAKEEIVAQKSSSLNEFRTDAETVMTNEKNVAVTEIHQMVDDFSTDADSKKQEIIQVADEKINDMTALKNDTVNAKNAAETAATTAVEKASETATYAGEAKSSSNSAKANADLVSANKIEIDNAKRDVDSKVEQFESDLETYSVRTLRSDMTELQKETSDGFSELKSDIGNIINTDYRDGYIIDIGGNKLQDDGYKVLKIICYKIKSITFANTVIGNQYVNSVSFYDVKNKFISGIKSDSYSQEVYTANVPDTAYYAVFTCLKSQNVSYRFDTDYVSVFLDRTNEIVRDYQNADNNKLDVIRGKNLFNKDTIIAGKFLYDNGGVGLNNDYFISDYIQIEGGEQYYIQALWTNGASNVFYDLNKNALDKSYSNQINKGGLTAPKSAAYIRLSGQTNTVNNLCFSKGTQEIPYEPYTDYKPLNLVEKKVEALESRFDTFVGDKTELQSTFAQTLSTDDTIDLEVPNIKFGKVISFHANVVSSGEIEISHGQSSWYNSGKIRVDASSVKYYSFTGQDNLEIELQHGLTISNTISISLNVNGVETMENGMSRIADLTVESNGKIFNTRMKWNGCNEKVQAKIISGEYTNCTLNFWSQDYKKDIWAYGDSYFDYWTLLAKKNGYGNFLCDGSSGRGSNDALNSLKLGLTHGMPKKILWCMGMNDADSSTAISAVYKKVIDEVVTLCDELGIELIITTIPNVPDRNHNYKNAYIKSLGKRIVDVSKAIGADDSANWFDGFLSSDNVHPSGTGARAIMSYMITSVPELLN